MQDNRTSTEIDQHKDELEKEYKKLQAHRSVIQDEYNKLRRQEIEIQQEKLIVMKQKQDVKIQLDKSKAMLNEVEADIKSETRAFWNARNAGI